MKVLAMVLAGGQGSRLDPLTAERSKPAVPFGSRYRIIDFVLSNLVNSQIYSIYLLIQYKSQSLIEHVDKAWGYANGYTGQFITLVPPQMREGEGWFQGTSDAVFQNINLIKQHAPDMVAVFGADHIYRMDVRQMIDFHHQHSAHVSVAAIPVPLSKATSFGVIDTDGDGRIQGFLEKPENPPPMPSDPSQSYGSMGNYLFETDVLLTALNEAISAAISCRDLFTAIGFMHIISPTTVFRGSIATRSNPTGATLVTLILIMLLITTYWVVSLSLISLIRSGLLIPVITKGLRRVSSLVTSRTVSSVPAH
jgi:ADP-glucose pyrophosphorylase